MDNKDFEDFFRRYTKYLDGEEGKTDYLAKIYFLLKGRSVVQDFDVLEIEAGIGFKEIH